MAESEIKTGIAPTFGTDIFSQVEQLAKEEGLTFTATEEMVKLEPEDVMGLVEFPFDVASILTKWEGYGLDEDESKRLSKLFLKPVSRLLAKQKHADLALAAITAVGIFVEKTFEYRVENHNRPRDEGKGKDQLSETKVS